MPTGVRYEMVRSLASGGMAQVYEAQATRQGEPARKVAVKRILPEHAADPRFRMMFLDEARLAGLLDHENIVRTLDFGFADGAELLVLEFVEGMDASRAFRALRAEEDPLVDALALFVVSRVARALTHAHGGVRVEGRRIEIVHRDVSPSNVLLGTDGEVKLSDFGIAKSDLRTERTRTGVIKGKDDFIAPEQAAGGLVGPAADVFALGVTLHALARGRAARALEERSPSLDQAVVALLEGCLANDPAERPSAASVAERAAALAEDAGASEAALAERVSRLARAPATRSAFDQALDLCFVSRGDGAFEVETRAATAASFPRARPRAREAEAEPPRSGRSPWKGLVVAAAIVTAGGVWLVLDGSMSGAEPVGESSVGADVEGGSARRDEPPSSGSSPSAERPGAESRSADSPGAEGPVAEGPVVSADAVERARPRETGETDELAGTSTAAAPARRASRGRSTPVAGRAVDRVAPDPSPSSADGDTPASPRDATPASGWIQVGGSTFLGARVLLDGHQLGHAPLLVAVPAGSHVLRVESPRGEVLLERSITTTPEHRRRAPLRVRP